MELCNVNVEKLRDFKLGRKKSYTISDGAIHLELIGEENDGRIVTRHYLLDGKNQIIVSELISSDGSIGRDLRMIKEMLIDENYFDDDD